MLEHRLNRLRVRSDETEEDSAAIKREIDNLRRQRLQQDLIFDKIKVALDRQEVDMASTMEQSNVLYAELEEIEAKKEKLRLHEQEQIREQKATIARMGEQLAAFKADAAAKREEAVLAHMQGLQATSSGSFRLGEMDNEQEKAAKSRLQAVEKRIAMVCCRSGTASFVSFARLTPLHCAAKENHRCPGQTHPAVERRI